MLKWDRIRKEDPERELRNASETHMSNVGTAVALNYRYRPFFIFNHVY